MLLKKPARPRHESCSLAGTILLCCMGMILYVASNSLAAEQEREVRIKVNDMSKNIDGPPGASRFRRRFGRHHHRAATAVAVVAVAV